MHILVVGGGMGGTILANNLARGFLVNWSKALQKLQCYLRQINICINQVSLCLQ